MQNVQSIRDKTFPLGYNDKFSPEEVPPGYCVEAINCFLEQRKIVERSGYSMVGDDTNDHATILGLGRIDVGSTRKLIRVSNYYTGSTAYVYTWSGSGDWVRLTAYSMTQDLPVEMEQAKGAVYMTNGTDTVLKYNGTTLTQVASFPKAFYLKWFHNIMFAWKTTANKSRLYYSNIGDPDTWGGSDYIDIEPDDGDEGTGLAALGDELIVAKKSYLKALSGWTDATFAVTDFSEKLNNYGAVSNRTFVNIGNDLLFLSYAGDVPHVRSLQRTKYAVNIYGGVISDDIEGTMKGINTAQLSKASAIFDGKNVWFFLPNGSSTHNNIALAYNVVTKGWTKHTGINASCAVSSEVSGEVVNYFGEAGAESRVYKFDASTSDNGEAISTKFTTRRFQPDFKRKYKYKYLWMHAETLGNYAFDVYTSIDGFNYDWIGEMNLRAADSVFPMTFPFRLGTRDVTRKRFDLGYSANYNIQLQIRRSQDAPRGTIRDYEFGAIPKGLRDAKE